MSQWYVSSGGQSSGPLTQHQVQQMAQSGQLGADAYVSGPGLNGWTPAAQVPQLSPAPAMAPAGGGAIPMQGPMQGQGMPGQPMGQGMPGHPMGQGVPGQPMGMPGHPMGMPGQSMGAPGMAGAPGAQATPAEPQSSWIKERLKGLGAIAIALLVLVANGVSIFSSGYFYPKSLILGLGALGFGGWVLIFGDEYDDYTLELVRWKQIGMWGCAAGGAAIGIALSVLLAS